MNSIAIVNWEDTEFYQRVTYSLSKQGYRCTEDYESAGVRTSVWTKESGAPTKCRTIGNDPLESIALIPADLLASRLAPRLATFMPPDTAAWELEWAAKNLAFDLMGKPG